MNEWTVNDFYNFDKTYIKVLNLARKHDYDCVSYAFSFANSSEISELSYDSGSRLRTAINSYDYNTIYNAFVREKDYLYKIYIDKVKNAQKYRWSRERFNEFVALSARIREMARKHNPECFYEAYHMAYEQMMEIADDGAFKLIDAIEKYKSSQDYNSFISVLEESCGYCFKVFNYVFGYIVL